MNRCDAMTGRAGSDMRRSALITMLSSILSIVLFVLACGPSPASALNTQEEINTVRVYKKISVATVLITSAYASTHHVNQEMGKGIGSGVLIDDQGLIVTNAHVVQGAAKLTVMLHDGTRLPAQMIGSDMVYDVALLRVAIPKGKYPHAQLGNSDKLEVGQKVIAIGHPFGLGYAMSTGIISGFGKLLETKQEVFQDRIIQTTTPINPGNSGGPLVDSDDRVIGINTAILLGAQNIGFAIPINTVKSVMADLQTYGRVIRPWLGVKGKFVTEELRTLIALPMVDGLLVQDVEEGSPAARIGLEAGELDVAIEGEPWVLGGDILVSINGQDLRTISHYTKTLQGLKADQAVELRVFRDGDYRTINLTLGERPMPPLPQQRPKTDVPPLIPQMLPYSQF
ncbi:putative DegP2 peptidase. Serine peptidase. MEROPS family S01B [Nitrospira japonica]|uniref:Putative DegP2 peptidase. Serine peptidase. MEROPS family S01B n=2 Tax=Nitrospira japonica TaxID=1325564 RepID=A0A1W1I703_9BACT|nr:putative DegP2 peptidase. Serine peptidase. MEROPS family S01B [Nitrospira japonica]